MISHARPPSQIKRKPKQPVEAKAVRIVTAKKPGPRYGIVIKKQAREDGIS